MKLPKVKLNLILTAALATVLLVELYLGYIYIFRNLTSESEEVAPRNVVRVNLERYQETVQFLTSQENYSAGPVNLKRPNPFRP
ncbi:MAG: hypothetical protein HY395_01900 [Candidatus Doudnabacteria bacterium]|nr:hypothetical protein [Candidatus Doudnabacteria bacterium]